MARGIVIAAAMLAGVGALAPAGVTGATTSRVTVKPVVAFTGEVGDRVVVGYFKADAGACAVTLMMADPASDDAPAASAARLTMTLQPSAAAALDSGDGHSLSVTCGESAASLIVDRHQPAGKLASR